MWANLLQHRGFFDTMISYKATSSEETKFSKDGTVLSCVEKLAKAMEDRDSPDNPGLNTCVLAVQAKGLLDPWPAIRIGEQLPFFGKRKLHQIVHFFAILHLLQKHDLVSATEADDLLLLLSMEQPTLRLPRSIKPPLQVSPARGRRWQQYRFSWPQKLELYDSDLQIYTWQPWSQKPPSEYLHVYLFGNEEKWQRSIIAFARLPRVVQRMRELRRTCKPHRAMMPIEHQCNDFLTAMVRYIQEEMVHFISEIKSEIEKMVRNRI